LSDALDHIKSFKIIGEVD